MHHVSLPWIPGYKCLSAKFQFPASSVSLVSIRSKYANVVSEEFRLYTNDAGFELTALKLPMVAEYEEVLRNH